MRISYNKLWKKLIDLDWTKQKLAEEAKISSASISKLKKGQNITTNVLVSICDALKCDLTDIMELVPDDPVAENKKAPDQDAE